LRYSKSWDDAASRIDSNNRNVIKNRKLSTAGMQARAGALMTAGTSSKAGALTPSSNRNTNERREASNRRDDRNIGNQ
jgi:hypothetical protein